MLSKAERKYLANEAEPEARAIAGMIDDAMYLDRLGEDYRERFGAVYGHVLVIPAMGESESLFTAIDSVPRGPLGPVLTVVVLNARESATASVHDANARARESLARFAMTAGDLWVIDRSQAGRFLPEGEGVGLARKLGADVAAALVWNGRLRSRFLHCTDADVILPADYFEQCDAFEVRAYIDGPAPAALLYRFEHQLDSDPETARAILLYESFLRYYVLGLRRAGSPYAFQTIGSTIAVDATTYAQVRGFPKRLAAEDFYLLNKVVKVGPVERLHGAAITIEGRESNRVPFGTGRSVHDILERGDTETTYRLPDPRSFDVLQQILRVLDHVAECGAAPVTDPYLSEALAAMGAFVLFDKLRAETLDTEQRRRRLHGWFDGFRTMKLLHWVRDHGYPSVPFFDALEEARLVPPGNGATEANGTERLVRTLEHLRTLEEANAKPPAAC